MNTPLLLISIFLLFTLRNVTVAQRYVDGSGSCGGSMPCYTILQTAINAAANGETIAVYPGTYTENITISKSITLVSTGGRVSTTLIGTQTYPSSLVAGTILITGSNTGINIGTTSSNGFTIVGVDLPTTDFTDVGAIYVQGPGIQTNLSIIGNEVRANGDDGFISEPGATINGFIFANNILSGKTFAGSQPNQSPGTTYFGAGANNVARTLFALNPRADGITPTTSNLLFTNNLITGTAGAGTNGNSLVQIAATYAAITQNTFSGTTFSQLTYSRGTLRIRGTNITIECNQFNSAGLSGAGSYHIQFDKGNSYSGGSTAVSTLAGVAQHNKYDANPVAYFDPIGTLCSDIQRSVFVNTTVASSYAACGGTVKTVTGSCQAPASCGCR